jgi:hypothetical protein
MVTCEGETYLLSYNPLPSQNPRSPGTSPLGLTPLNRKNLPIEVTLGRIGSSYASLPFHIYLLSYCKPCDNKTQVIIREEMFHKFSALDVTNMGTMQEVV